MLGTKYHEVVQAGPARANFYQDSLWTCKCGCAFRVNKYDTWLNVKLENRRFGATTCPQCYSTAILEENPPKPAPAALPAPTLPQAPAKGPIKIELSIVVFLFFLALFLGIGLSGVLAQLS